LDLHTASRRYEEGRRFWAREIAVLLARRYSSNWQILLRKLLGSDHPLLATTLSECFPVKWGSKVGHETHTVNMLRDLMRGGMVTRTGNRRAYRYAITELGELVCMYLFVDQDGDAKEHPPLNDELGAREHPPLNDELGAREHPPLNDELGAKEHPPLNDELGARRKRRRPRKTLVAAPTG
jgi:hypothetical protein